MEQGNPRRSTFTAHRMLIKLTETKPSCPRGSARTYSTIYASKEPECKESVKRVKIIRGVKKKKKENIKFRFYQYFHQRVWITRSKTN